MLEFFVPGIPATAGSKKPFIYKGKDGKQHASMAPDNKRQKPWMSDVKLFASEKMSGNPPTRNPIILSLVFVLPRPKSHYRTGKNSGILKNSAPKYVTKKPDSVKMTRAVEDALTGVVWIDDAQVVRHFIVKIYGDIPGVRVKITEITLQDLKGETL